LFVSFILIAIIQTGDRAQAIPIFAQRYLLSCKTCHSVLPELNEFGRNFRAHGYRLPLPVHGTTVVALRYQVQYLNAPPAGTRRWAPAGVLLGNANFGAITAFVHYNLGAGGAPSAFYLAFLATYNEHTKTEYRGGLFELPLAQSPGQRLDDLQQYGYYGAHVGLNDLTLASPRWGIDVQHAIGTFTSDLVVDDGEFKGSAYGGKPIPTGETTSAGAAEAGIFLRGPLFHPIEVGGEFMGGTRLIIATGKPGFDDPYVRKGLLLRTELRQIELQAEQWWGDDWNADGSGTHIRSSGGYARLKYYPTPHSYLAVRYDAQATPFVMRDMVYYFAFMPTPHTRLLFQQVQNIGGTSFFGGAFTIALPWPLKVK
jgi:hypothetical protein